MITDVLWFILLLLLAIGIYWVRQDEWLRSQWHKILDHPTAILCSIIIALFIGITTLDSIRFGEQHKTLLDRAFNHLTQPETTYSKPFATHSLTKETVRSGQAVARIAPLLKHTQKDMPKIQRLLLNVLWSLACTVILIIPLLFAWRRLKPSNFQHDAFLLKSMLCLIALISWLIITSHHYHILGTDKVGNDVFLESLKGVRTAVLIGTLTTFIMLPFAIALGVIAGYFRGWIDDIVQYIYTTLNAIPGILLISAMILLAQAVIQNNLDWFDSELARIDFRFLMLCLILGLTSWTGLCRLLRAETLKLRNLDYVNAAYAFGCKSPHILRQHILPNISHLIIISVVVDFSSLVLAEAVLSYIGIGVEPSMPSWGNMINHARLELARIPIVWWTLVATFSFMLLLVLAVNLLADRVRDVFDPKYHC